MATEKLTVITAHGGTEALGGNSIVGHIYYVLTDSNGKDSSYGFAPLIEHSMDGTGKVFKDDKTNYSNLTYSSTTIDITPEQYTTLEHFGTFGEPGYLNGFASNPSDPNYNILTKSCIDLDL